MWLKQHDPVAIVLDEVPEDTDPWPVEQQWIEKFSSPDLLNKNGHDLGRARRKRRSGGESPSAAAA